MRPTRRTQPYRKGARQQTRALSAMLRGRGAMPNPMDPKRALEKGAGKRKRRGRLAGKLSARGRTVR